MCSMFYTHTYELRETHRNTLIQSHCNQRFIYTYIYVYFGDVERARMHHTIHRKHLFDDKTSVTACSFALETHALTPHGTSARGLHLRWDSFLSEQRRPEKPFVLPHTHTHCAWTKCGVIRIHIYLLTCMWCIYILYIYRDTVHCISSMNSSFFFYSQKFYVHAAFDGLNSVLTHIVCWRRCCCCRCRRHYTIHTYNT